MARRVLLSAAEIASAIHRIADAIVSSPHGLDGLALVGVYTRGVALADRVAAEILARVIDRPGFEIARGTVDITLYRDDLAATAQRPIVRGSEINFDVSDKRIVLVDDVCFTGRTTRAALDQVIDFGRPRLIELAVLVDRGHRELPICPTFVGAKFDTARTDNVLVRLSEIDGIDEVLIEST